MKDKKIRKHQGIHQTGGKRGHLKKGYKYSGQRTKSGLPIILKVNKSKKQYNQRGGTTPDFFDFLQDRLLETNIIDEEGNVLWNHLITKGDENTTWKLDIPKEQGINWILNQIYINENKCNFLDEKKVMERWNEIINECRKVITNVLNIVEIEIATGSLMANKIKELMETPVGITQISKVIDLINNARNEFMNIEISELMNEKMTTMESEMLKMIVKEHTTNKRNNNANDVKQNVGNSNNQTNNNNNNKPNNNANETTKKTNNKRNKQKGPVRAFPIKGGPVIRDLHLLYRKNYNKIKVRSKKFVDEFWNSDEIKKIKNTLLETVIPLGQYRIKIPNIDDFTKEYKQKHPIKPTKLTKPKLVRSQSVSMPVKKYSKKYFSEEGKNAFIKNKITEEIIPLFYPPSERADAAPMSFVHQDKVRRLLPSLGLKDGSAKVKKWITGTDEYTEVDEKFYEPYATAELPFEFDIIAKSPNIRAAFCTSILNDKKLKPVVFNMYTIFHELGHMLTQVDRAPDTGWQKESYDLTINIEGQQVNIRQFVHGSEKNMKCRYMNMINYVKENHRDLQDISIEKNEVLNQFFNSDHMANIPKINDLIADVMCVEIFMEIFKDNKLSNVKCVESLMAMMNILSENENHFNTQVRKIWNFVINKKLYKYYEDWLKESKNYHDDEYKKQTKLATSKLVDLAYKSLITNIGNLKQWKKTKFNSGMWKHFFKNFFQQIINMTPDQQNDIMVKVDPDILIHVIDNAKSLKLKLPEDFTKKKVHRMKYKKYMLSITPQNRKQSQRGISSSQSYEEPIPFKQKTIKKQKFNNNSQLSQISNNQAKQQFEEFKKAAESSKKGGKRKTKRIANLKSSKKGGKRKTKK